MNKAQFLSALAPTIAPCVLIVLAWPHSNSRADRIEKSVDGLSGRMDAMSGRIDRLTENFNNQVTALLTTIHSVDVRVVKLEERK